MNNLKIFLKKSIHEYNKEEYLSLLRVLTYPRYSKKELSKRLTELQELGIKAIEFSGPAQLNNLRVLGKGTMGIVILGYWGETKVAIKVLRTDVKTTMKREARYLKIANSVSVGPKLIGYSRNFLIREFIDGDLLKEVIVKESPKKLLKIILAVLHQAFKLDTIGLSHKELARPDRHIIIRSTDLKPFIIDFGAASVISKKKNLTQLIQYLSLIHI